MSIAVTMMLDDETAAYLDRIAADQGRTPADVAAWIVTEDLRREQAIDAELVARLDCDESAIMARSVEGETAQRERAGA